MSEQSQLDYYARRARQERERVQCATDPAVRMVHRQLAATYEIIVETGQVPEPRTRPRLAPIF